ncbi:MAG: hypothetical protein U1B30_08170, partial [Pseudomonadota bacterium]|nr:hypothetical protein [Pseudomonadota bacterium]
MSQIPGKLNFISALLLATALSACGGGSGDTAVPVDTGAAAASLIAPANAKLQWQVGVLLSVTLSDAQG